MRRNAFIILMIAVLLVGLVQTFQPRGERMAVPEWSYSELLDNAEQGKVSRVTLQSNRARGEATTGHEFVADVPNDQSALLETLRASGVAIKVEPPEQASPLWSLIGYWLPIILFIAFFIFMIRQAQAGGGKAMSFGKSRARMLTEKTGRVTFDDVAGIDESKQELEEVVEFLRDPQKFQRLGGKIPKGVLLVGPPGTGKTLLARAIAGEANVPFFTISGSDFVEMFVGVGASRVRDMFEQGKKNAPCIIFIDEIDAVGRHRGAGLGGGNDEREQTLNQLLVEMDGFEANEGVILIAATNRPDVLDPALLRPGRFDRQVVVPNPDILGRERILKVHMRKVPLGPDVEPRTIARGTPGFSGADLANLVNEAALMAARRNKRLVSMQDLEDAKDKVMMGAERRSMVMTEEDKKLTAYHEAGHALCGIHMEGSDPVHKATIIPRGRALGMVMRLPERDEYAMTRQKAVANLVVAMGGRLAEEMIFGHDKVTSGAAGDIQMATNLARTMVMKWGMSDKLGPLAYAAPDEEVFLGHTVTRHQTIAADTQRTIDEEVFRLVNEAEIKAKEILTEHGDQLEIIAQGLLEYETLSGDDIKALLRGETIVRPDPSDDTDGGASDGGGLTASVPESGAGLRGFRGPDPSPAT